ncbi:MAG: LamG-like jellyroll fold domain-containing protein, partial [Candidatus Thermoplasmatota archaeon]
IIHVGDTRYAIVYGGGKNQFEVEGKIKTITITLTGDIDVYAGGSYTFNNPINNFYDPCIVDLDKVNGYFTVVYKGYYGYVNLSTFNIFSSTGSVSHVKTVSLGSDGGFTPIIKPVKRNSEDGVYVVVYKTGDDSGLLKTVKMKNTGVIPCRPVVNASELCVNRLLGFSKMLPVSSNIVAILYPGFDSSCFIKTAKIVDGVIEDRFLDFFVVEIGRLSHDSSVCSGERPQWYDFCFYPDMIHVSGDVYAVAYYGRDNGGADRLIIKTVSINPVSGKISYINKAELVQVAYYVSIIKVTDEYYAVSLNYYIAGELKCGVVTVCIKDGGKTISLVDELVIENTMKVEYRDMTRVYWDNENNKGVFAMVYRYTALSPNNRLVVSTFEIDGSGFITDNVLKRADIDSCNNSAVPRIIPVADSKDRFVIIYRNTSNTGYLRTIRIYDNGKNISNIDIFKIGSSLSGSEYICYIEDRIYAVVYQTRQGSLYRYNLSFIKIGENGHINESFDNTTRFLFYMSYPNMIKLPGTSYHLLLYCYYPTILSVSSITVDKTPTPGHILKKKSCYGVYAMKNEANIILTAYVVNATGFSHTLTGFLTPKEWNHITIVYKEKNQEMRLYISTDPNQINLVSSSSISGKDSKINTSTYGLTFGSFNGFYDDFVIYNRDIIIGGDDLSEEGGG